MLCRVARSFKSRSALLSSQLGHNVREFALPAHGTADGELTNVLIPRDSDAWQVVRDESLQLPEIVLTRRHMCDLELILNGGFSPLDGYLSKAQYDSVVSDMRLPDGTLWPVPVCLDINEAKGKEIEADGRGRVSLKDQEGNTLAVLSVADIWSPDKSVEADKCWGGDPEHPAIAFLNNNTENVYIGGKLDGLQLPPSYDYQDLRKTPAQLRALFAEKGWDKVAAFQTRNPMHRAHYELTLLALQEAEDMKILVHPVVGMTKPGDIDHHTRVKCYKEIMPKYPEGRAELSVFPLAMRMGGPREAIWHAIIRKNHGATHFIAGRDHAGPGSNSAGVDFYGPYDARDAVKEVEDELGIQILSYEMQVYSEEHDRFYSVNEVPEGVNPKKLSGTEVRKRLATGEDIPEWFSFGPVVNILRKANPPHSKKGFTIFFTGLSGSGKTTVANALQEKLMEIQDRAITMLDGDIVRQLLSSGLGFSRDDRQLNIKRIGYVSSLITKSGGAVIAAPIAPHEEARAWVRETVSQEGGFFLVHLQTPLETCEERDRKGLYKKAREGILKGMTGIDDPYEIPEVAELRIDTATSSIAQSVDTIVSYLAENGYVEGEAVAR